jgi:hypothetical protein
MVTIASPKRRQKLPGSICRVAGTDLPPTSRETVITLRLLSFFELAWFLQR